MGKHFKSVHWQRTMKANGWILIAPLDSSGDTLTFCPGRPGGPYRGDKQESIEGNGWDSVQWTLITASFTALTISPCCPGIPDVPGKPRSPCEEETATHSFGIMTDGGSGDEFDCLVIIAQYFLQNHLENVQNSNLIHVLHILKTYKLFLCT